MLKNLQSPVTTVLAEKFIWALEFWVFKLLTHDAFLREHCLPQGTRVLCSAEYIQIMYLCSPTLIFLKNLFTAEAKKWSISWVVFICLFCFDGCNQWWSGFTTSSVFRVHFWRNWGPYACHTLLLSLLHEKHTCYIISLCLWVILK